MLQFETLDPDDVEALVPLLRHASTDTGHGMALDLPLLPAPVEIVNADIDLDIARILLKLVDISEVSLNARIRNGRLQRSPFHAHIGKASFRGHLDPATGKTDVVFEDEVSDDSAGGRMDGLFSNVVRWAGGNAIVPLRWIFRKKLAEANRADCLPGDTE